MELSWLTYTPYITTGGFEQFHQTLNFDHERNVWQRSKTFRIQAPQESEQFWTKRGFSHRMSVFCVFGCIHFPVLTVLWRTSEICVRTKSWVQHNQEVDEPCISRDTLDSKFSSCFCVILVVSENSLFVHQAYLEIGDAITRKSEETFEVQPIMGVAWFLDRQELLKVWSTYLNHHVQDNKLVPEVEPDQKDVFRQSHTESCPKKQIHLICRFML